jgi:ADP-heptose:LPS heptosyltransferase
MSRPVICLPPRPRIAIPIVAGIGNALLAVPLVRQLGRGVERCHITIIARTAAMAEVFRRLPEVREVRLMRPEALGMALGVRLVPRPDLCLIPFPSNRWQYYMLALASGARQRLLHSYPVGRLAALGCLPATRLPAVRGLHDVVQNLFLLRPLGIEPNLDDAPNFPLLPAERQRVGELLAGAGLPADSRPIVIHAGSANTVLAAAKRWPPDRYAALIEALRRLFPEPVLILEGPDELGVAEAIGRFCGPNRPAVLPLRGPLAEAAAVLERAVLYVGTDSGLAHLAAAVGTPPVTLFAPSDPERVCPFGYRHLVVQPRGRSCAPCFQYPWTACRPKLKCRPPLCIDDVHPDDVLEAVKRARGG